MLKHLEHHNQTLTNCDKFLIVYHSRLWFLLFLLVRKLSN